MKRLSCAAIGLAFACAAPLHAAQTGITVRGAEEPTPDKKEWERGASIAHVKVNDKSTSDIDAVVLLEHIRGDYVGPADGVTGQRATMRWKAGIGPYMHRLRGAETPEDDRGVAVTLGANFVPSNASGPVAVFDLGAVYKKGDKLTAMSTEPKTYVDVDSERLILTGSAYYEPNRYSYIRGTIGAYTDRASDSPTATLNGRETGLLSKAQLSLYPLSVVPADILPGNLTVTPLLTFIAQKQWGKSASGLRALQDRELWSATLSLQFARDNSGIVPSLDISRSIGADIIEGREQSAKTSVTLSVKY